ncbi:MgtC/SapB family protein [Microvirga arabica]|uniref:MgtC/SapB family protein n=1 Tax=Microvirga arabica TaxID=1128671 RepID=UPI0019396EDB|nr:MgtC/SapB family protein [Microvirga arabica]MBM1172806.1 MgtC/SapB family protein [Microvirga arabica]
MNLFDFDWSVILHDLAYMGIAFALAFPIGWERGCGYTSIGFRTFPIVAIAACGFALLVKLMPGTNAESQARVLQGIISGIGFIGGGAIVKHGTDVRGLVTAASIWNAGAIGVAVGYNRLNIAVVLSITNLLVLWLLTPLAERHRSTSVEDGEK